jgi:signal peptidase I
MASFRKSTAREYLEAIVIAVTIALFIRTFIVQAYKIPTGSMEDNLLVGDHLLVNKFEFGPTETGLERWLLPVRNPRRGDVVVFKFPGQPERDFIKRVIGLPGETLEVRDKRVYIDGRPISEPYVRFLEVPETPSNAHEAASFDVRERFGPVKVPPGQFFVMGDNRDNSEDSRYWGFLPRRNIKGLALMVYWSYDARGQDRQGTGLLASARAFASAAVRVFTWTRWNRLFHQIR